VADLKFMSSSLGRHTDNPDDWLDVPWRRALDAKEPSAPVGCAGLWVVLGQTNVQITLTTRARTMSASSKVRL
jgi:hypothetical protein